MSLLKTIKTILITSALWDDYYVLNICLYSNSFNIKISHWLALSTIQMFLFMLSIIRILSMIYCKWITILQMNLLNDYDEAVLRNLRQIRKYS